jgi:hypothetical protein
MDFVTAECRFLASVPEVLVNCTGEAQDTVSTGANSSGAGADRGWLHPLARVGASSDTHGRDGAAGSGSFDETNGLLREMGAGDALF